jgi:hypothetical protein
LCGVEVDTVEMMLKSVVDRERNALANQVMCIEVMERRLALVLYQIFEDIGSLHPCNDQSESGKYAVSHRPRSSS